MLSPNERSGRIHLKKLEKWKTGVSIHCFTQTILSILKTKLAKFCCFLINKIMRSLNISGKLKKQNLLKNYDDLWNVRSKY